MTEQKPKAPRGRPKTFDSERTLEIAIDGYWRQGPHGMSLNEVCRRAAISKPGLYREFGNEDHLMNTVLTHYSERVLAPLLQLLHPQRSFSETLDTVIEIITTQQESRPAGCLLVKLRASPSQLGPITRAHVERLTQELITAYIGCIDQAKDQGEINVLVDTELAARFIDAQLNNILNQMSAGEDPELIRAQAHLAFAGLTGRDVIINK